MIIFKEEELQEYFWRDSSLLYAGSPHVILPLLMICFAEYASNF